MNLFTKLKEMKILLIDDDEWIRDSLHLFFESEGCQITVLETAEEGMEEIKEHTYDIIIADYRLPGMDGLEFIKRINESYPEVMKILITAYGSREVIAKANRIGVQNFIEKPFTTNKIEESIGRLIESREKKYIGTDSTSYDKRRTSSTFEDEGPDS